MGYDLERFIAAQERDYATALSEIKSGYKRSHWMWYILPQISGLGHSSIAKKYEIVDIGEAKAYMDNAYLRSNLVEISRALLECGNDDIEDIMGFPDNFKLCSSMTLFEIVAPEVDEFKAVLKKFFNGKRDKRTIEILAEKREDDRFCPVINQVISVMECYETVNGCADTVVYRNTNLSHEEVKRQCKTCPYSRME